MLIMRTPSTDGLFKLLCGNTAFQSTGSVDRVDTAAVQHCFIVG